MNVSALQTGSGSFSEDEDLTPGGRRRSSGGVAAAEAVCSDALKMCSDSRLSSTIAFTKFNSSFSGKERVGVPGHQSYDYTNDWNACTQFLGSIWQQIFYTPLYWLYTFLYVVLMTVFGIWSDDRSLVGFRLPDTLGGIITSIAIFTITFYNANAFSVYRERVNVIFATNSTVEKIYGVAAVLMRKAPDLATVLIRYSNAILNFNYFQISDDMSDKKWQTISNRGILSHEEVGVLSKSSLSYSTVVLSWALTCVRKAEASGIISGNTSEALSEALNDLRGLSSQQKSFSYTQIPRPYFHSMWLSVQSFAVVTIWYSCVHFAQAIRGVCDADEMADDDSSGGGTDGIDEDSIACIGSAVTVAIAGFWVYTLVFALFAVGIALSDPIGDEPTDYDLTADINRLWTEGYNIIQAGADGALYSYDDTNLAKLKTMAAEGDMPPPPPTTER